jgi:hypothetical protein
MMRNRTNAMPSERIQLSNHRPSLDRRLSGGPNGTGAGEAPEPPLGAPNSCMAFTLARRPARRNGHRPTPSRPPPPQPVPEIFRPVAVPDAGREARGVPFSLETHPRDLRVRQRFERSAVERRPSGREDDDQGFVIHGTGTVASQGVTCVTRLSQAGTIEREKPRSSIVPTPQAWARTGIALQAQRPWGPTLERGNHGRTTMTIAASPYRGSVGSCASSRGSTGMPSARLACWCNRRWRAGT